jgi:hypothetical protein
MMSENDRPLPTPPATPFMRGRRSPPDAEHPLTVDRMAVASAEGRLQELLDTELGGNEHAKALAAMVMGMSGFASPGGFPPPPGAEPAAATGSAGGVPPPADVARAAHTGDVSALVDLLRREHGQRNPEASPGGLAPPAPEGAAATAASAAGPAPAPALAEREVLEELLAIAAENGVGVDWLTLRALKLYVADHRRTGRL